MTSNKKELTQELLKELIDYNPDTGVFTWKERPLSMFKCERDCKAWNARYKNKVAGCSYINWKNKVNAISIKPKTYLCHILTYFYMNGNWPKEDIDCIDGDFTNLKWNNIRECTRTDSNYKQINPQRENKLMGISFIKERNKYESKIKIKGKTIHLGRFNTQEEAHQAYVDAKRQISPEFSML